MLAIDSRVASALSNSETTPDPTYYNDTCTVSLTGTETILPGNLAHQVTVSQSHSTRVLHHLCQYHKFIIC